MSTFTQSLGENNKFAEYLTKVFKKRVKRTKKKATDGAGTFNFDTFFSYAFFF